jgi:hypothetical protein
MADIPSCYETETLEEIQKGLSDLAVGKSILGLNNL